MRPKHERRKPHLNNYRGPKREIEIREVLQVKGKGIQVSLVSPSMDIWLPVHLVEFVTREWVTEDHRIARIPVWLYRKKIEHRGRPIE